VTHSVVGGTTTSNVMDDLSNQGMRAY